MMKGKKEVLSFAEKFKSILVSNWKGQLNTVKADSKGSKGEIYSSKVRYILKKGKPYIWVPEKELHNVNSVVDERGSFAVASPIPGPLVHLLKAMKKLPARVALTGEILPLGEKKVQSITENLKELILSEERAIRDSTYTVSSLLSSSNHVTTSRSESLKELLDEGENYVVYKFDVSSCMIIDSNDGTLDVELEDIATTKADVLAPFSAKLIDGINQSEARRRALTLFCVVYLKANARDAYMLSVDRKGFEMLGKVPSRVSEEEGEYVWKQFRFTFKEEAQDVESFCRMLVEMEEEAVNKLSSSSGLGLS